MIKGAFTAGVICGLLGAGTSAVFNNLSASAPLSDLQKARAENYLLKRRLLTSECQAGIQSLEAERTKLETELIAAQSCEAGWNWDTLTCTKAPEPKADEGK